jgi:RNA polymerase subunit RPABC4/transcription elongation factor Spt4
MRCHKCGYISFDDQDNCKKCQKPVKSDEYMEGVIFAVTPPLFLEIDKDLSGGTDDIWATEPVVEDSMNGDNQQDTAEIEIDFGREGDLQLAPDDDSKSDLEEIYLCEDDSLNGAIAFDSENLSNDSKEDQSESDIQFDLADIDISDLAPPEENSTFYSPDDNVELTLDLEKLDISPVAEPEAKAVLDDLLLDGLDLDTSAPTVAGSKSSHILRPSLKTGTALDDFEVDLGDLIAKEK